MKLFGKPSVTHFKDEWSWLSNFYPAELVYNGVEYRSVEHAYMSAKSEDPEWKKICQETASPGKVKQQSRDISLNKNWHEVKLGVMEELLKIKFSQEPFKSQLIATEDALLIEGNWWGDTFWGVCDRTGKGENWLGVLIMRVRADLIATNK